MSFATDREPVIAGLGMTALGKIYGRTALQFAADAVRDAARDAGLLATDIDGLIVSSGTTAALGMSVQSELGLADLRLHTFMQAYGTTAAQMVQYAAMAVRSGMADTIAVVWADDPLKENSRAGDAYATAAVATGWSGIRASHGLSSANAMYAVAAKRHMMRYGTTQDQLGAIAVAQREWAMLNPLAQFRTPLTLDDYHASRWIAEPFHLYDCCMVSNGGIAVIVTTRAHASGLRQSPVGILGWAQAHPGGSGARNDDFGLISGAARSGPAALRMAGTSLDEIDLVQLYDCYTFTAMITLEDYGFCEKGQGGPFVADPGAIGPGGRLKLNTGGGQLSAYYMWGMTPLSEAIIQARGQAGDRQVAAHDRVLVSGNGGILDYHATLVLGTL